jgi:maltoporin
MPDPADIPSGFYISTPTNNAIANAPAIGIGPTGFGTVTQGTSKTQGVTLNAKAGVITMHNAALASSAAVQFTLTNSAISGTDVVVTNQGTGGTAGSYNAHCVDVGAGSAIFRVINTSAGSLGEAVTLNFVVIDTTAG